MKYHQSQILWYPKCCFLSPTSWQPLFNDTAISSLLSLQAYQHKRITVSRNLQMYIVWSLLAWSESYPKCATVNIQQQTWMFKSLITRCWWYSAIGYKLRMMNSGRRNCKVQILAYFYIGIYFQKSNKNFRLVNNCIQIHPACLKVNIISQKWIKDCWLDKMYIQC
jgi:hypothetical protein